MLNFLLLLIGAGSGSGPSPSPGFPTVQDLKDYLRIEHADEDALLATLLARAQSILSSLLGNIPLTSEEFTFVDRSQEGIQFKLPRTLMVPMRPIGGAITVTDADGVAVDSSTYTVDAIAGVLYAKSGYSFPNGPYTITCRAGIAYRRGYTERIQPLLGSMIIDLAADLYQRRTPAASSESAAGTSVSWNASAEVIVRLMPHVKMLRRGSAFA